MTLITLILLLFWPHLCFAAPTVTINSIPDGVITAGTSFPVTFTINEASSTATYYYKFFGGIDTDVYKITNGSGFSYTSPWANFPQVTLNPGVTNTFTGVALVDSGMSAATLNLKVKIALVSNTGTNTTSPPFPIEVVPPQPTSTPVPTQAPTIVPTNTSTPKPTNTPTNTPTLTPTPTPEITSTEDNQTSDSPVLGSIITVTPTPKLINDKKNNQNLIPSLLIGIGGLLLLTPLILGKINHAK